MNLFAEKSQEMLSYMSFWRGRNIKFLDRRETLQYALRNNYSISRFGDGELEFAFRGKFKDYEGIHFQQADLRLCTKLRDVLFKPISNVLVCINYAFSNSNQYHVILDYERTVKDYSRYESVHRPNDVAVVVRKNQRCMYCRRFIVIKRKTALSCFGEATCFMLQHFYQDFAEKRIQEILDLYQRFFCGKRILFVCPETPFMGLSFRQLCNQGIISSARSVDFISIPEKDCFEYYDSITKEILSFGSLDAVFVQAGPTATVLVAELMEHHGLLGYDIGSWNVSIQKGALLHNRSF